MSYKKGKDIKQQGDCLCYCYTRKIKLVSGYIETGNEFWYTGLGIDKPEGFEKW